MYHLNIAEHWKPPIPHPKWGTERGCQRHMQEVVPHMALTDLKVRKAKAEAKPYKMYDSLGLFVLVKPNGSKLWRQKYKH